LIYTSSTQTIAWFKNLYLADNLEIKPPYQRRPVWALRQKSQLIESLLLELPVPEIYVHTTTSSDGETHYAVVDGQQRIRAILQFIGIDRDEQDFNAFALEQLENSDSPWKDKRLDDLTPEQKQQFYGYKLSVRVLEGATDSEVREMFKRLNKYLTKLNEQELRNAIYSGPFVGFVNELADDDYWAENRLVPPALIRRMKDIEFVSELVIGTIDGPQGSVVLDDYYLQYETYQDEFPKQRDIKRLFDKTLRTIQAVLPEIKDTRWRNRTDFYSLFVATAHLLRENNLPESRFARLRSTLSEFGRRVDSKIADEDEQVPENIAEYARAAEKGSNEKSRRAARHEALLTSIQRHFSPRRGRGS
jgi:hypothetical protein